MWDLVDHFYIITVKDSPRISDVKVQTDYFKIPEEKLTWNIIPRLNYKGDLYGSQVENHIIAYRDALSKGYNNILIFEDDIHIFGSPEEIKNKINTIHEKVDYFLKNYKDYDILFLGSLPWYLDSSNNDNGIVKCHGTSIQCYLINQALFSMFIDINIELKIITCVPYFKVMLDYWIYCLSTHRNKSYAIYPMLVFQNNLPFVKNMPAGKEVFKLMSQSLEFFSYRKEIIMVIIIVLIIIIIIIIIN